MTLQEARTTLTALEPEAMLSARRLAADSEEHLLAEAEFASSVRDAGLGECIVDFVQEYGAGDATRLLWGRYPACCAFYLIDAGQREYEHGSLYPEISRELGVNHQWVMSWGDRFLSFLDEIGLQRFWADQVTRYRLESILLHGGLPDDAWQQIWREWILPAVEVGRTEADVQDMIDFALSGGHAAPQLRKTTRDILFNPSEMVTRLVVNAISAGRAVKLSGFVDEDADYNLPVAAIEQLQQVLEAPRIRWPELVFEPGVADPVKVCVPAQRVPRAFRSRIDAAYDVFSCTGEGQLLAHDDVPGVLHGSSFTLDGSSLMVSPEAGYDVTARLSGIGRNGDTQERRMRWRAPSSLPVWVFPQRNRAGAERFICEPLSARVRPFSRAAYLVPPGVRLEAAEGASIEEATPLFGRWGGWCEYLVSAPSGGAVIILDSSGRECAGWSIGRTCSIRLERDEELAVGTLIAEKLPTNVYGEKLPAVRVRPVDLGETLDLDEWSCRIEWGSASSRESVVVELHCDGQSSLVAELNEASDRLPSLVTDGYIVCEGPESAGYFRRAFARVPLRKPQLLAIGGASVLAGLNAKYVVRSETRTKFRDHDDVAQVRRLPSGAEYEVSTKLATDRLTLSVGEAGASVPMHLSLAGVAIEPDETAGRALALERIPRAVLEKHAAGFIKIHTHSGSAAEMRLRLVGEDGTDAVLRSVGTDGRYTETLGLGELIAALPSGSPAVLMAELSIGGLNHRQDLVEVLPGLGLGKIELTSRQSGAVVRASSCAVAPISFYVKDLAAPWREMISGVMEEGSQEAELGPRPYELCVGKYAIWAEPYDEWGDQARPDLSGEPVHVELVTQDRTKGGCRVRGPYQESLAELLRFNAGVGPRPRLGALRDRPALGMLQADASDTVSAAFGSLHAGLDAAVELGTDIMRLGTYRYAMCPPVLRALTDFASHMSDTGQGAFAQGAVLRLPCLPVRAQNSSVFGAEELARMWEIDPLLGWMGSAMHSRCGETDPAVAPILDWLQRIGVRGTAASDLRSQLHIPQGTMLGLVEGVAYSSGAVGGSSISMESFARWYESQTTRDRFDASTWVANKLPGMREGIASYAASHSPIRTIASEIRSRDVGDDTKTIANLPFVIGVLSITSLALAWDDPNAQLLTAYLGENGTADKTHAGITRSLLEAGTLCYELLTQDMTLVRLAYEGTATGELI